MPVCLINVLKLFLVEKPHCVTFIVGRDQRRCISHLAVTSTWQGDSAHVTWHNFFYFLFSLLLANFPYPIPSLGSRYLFLFVHLGRKLLHPSDKLLLEWPHFTFINNLPLKPPYLHTLGEIRAASAVNADSFHEFLYF